jgi:hypothetical protein
MSLVNWHPGAHERTVDRAVALFEGTRPERRPPGDSYCQGFYLTNLAHLAIQGDGDSAAERYPAGAHLARLGTPNLAMALKGSPGRSRSGHAEQAARLFGGAQALRDLVGTALLPHWQADHDRARAAAQTALGERAFAAAWTAGRAMTVEQAIFSGLAAQDDGHSEGGRSAGARDGAARPALSPREAGGPAGRTGPDQPPDRRVCAQVSPSGTISSGSTPGWG